MKKLLLSFVLLLIPFYIFADEDDSEISPILEEGIEKTKDEINELFSSFIEEKVKNSILSYFLKTIGKMGDDIYFDIKNIIEPGFIRLNFLDISNLREQIDSSKVKNYSFQMINSTSFIGQLMTLLLILECVYLGLKCFLEENFSLRENTYKLVRFFLMLIVVAFLPTISDLIIDIFSVAGCIASGLYSSGFNRHFKPSDVLLIYNQFLTLLNQTTGPTGAIKASLFSLFMDAVKIGCSIPFFLLMIQIILWYLEMSFIMLTASVTLPLVVFEYTAISDLKTILRSMLKQGIKIFVGIFCLGSFMGIVNTFIAKGLFVKITSYIYQVLIVIFVVLMFYVISIKAPCIALSSLNGDVISSQDVLKSSASTLLGTFGGSFLAHHLASNNKNNDVENIKDGGNGEEDYKLTKLNDLGKKDDGEVSSRVTERGYEIAAARMRAEGRVISNRGEITRRAQRDANIDKLEKLSKTKKLSKVQKGQYNKLIKEREADEKLASRVLSASEMKKATSEGIKNYNESKERKNEFESFLKGGYRL